MVFGSCYEERVVKCELIKGFGGKVVDGIKKEQVIGPSVDIDRLTIKFKDGTKMVIESWDRESYISGLNIEE